MTLAPAGRDALLAALQADARRFEAASGTLFVGPSAATLAEYLLEAVERRCELRPLAEPSQPTHSPTEGPSA